jgi:hypothetical protein
MSGTTPRTISKRCSASTRRAVRPKSHLPSRSRTPWRPFRPSTRRWWPRRTRWWSAPSTNCARQSSGSDAGRAAARLRDEQRGHPRSGLPAARPPRPRAAPRPSRPQRQDRTVGELPGASEGSSPPTSPTWHALSPGPGSSAPSTPEPGPCPRRTTLATIHETRPTVSSAMAHEFAVQTEKFARIQVPSSEGPVCDGNVSSAETACRRHRRCR